jgi:hypothetical protein
MFVMVRKTTFVRWAEEAEARRLCELVSLYDEQVLPAFPAVERRASVVSLLVALLRSPPRPAHFARKSAPAISTARRRSRKAASGPPPDYNA